MRKTTNFQLNNDVLAAFKIECIKRDTTMSRELRKMIVRWLKEVNKEDEINKGHSHNDR